MDNKLFNVALVAVAGGAMFYALAYPYLSGAAQAQKRQAAFVKNSREVRSKVVDPAQRRKAIAESVKVLDADQNDKKVSLSTRISQAGLSLSEKQFWIASAVFAVLASGGAYWFNGDLLVALGVAVVALFGIPRWVLSYLGARRIKKFILAFPDALDMIIRGIKAGLPVGDCFRLIAKESPQPLAGEFERIVEAQAVGLTIGEAVEKLSDRIRIPETSFFAIVVNVQQKTGGNLSEALANLSNVLRERKRMKDKIQAISSEAKASAGIIGSLPFIVGGLVYFVSPDYIMILFTTTIGNLILAGTLVWMSIGVFVMRSMINFEV